RPLPQASCLPSQIEQAPPSRGEPVDRPTCESEEPQFLCGWRVDCQAVRVVRVALRGANLVGIAIAPHGAFTKQPMRAEARSGEQQRRPPGVAGKHYRRRQSAYQSDETGRDEGP